MSDTTGWAALIAELRNESGIGTMHINDPAALMDKAADALIRAGNELSKAHVDAMNAHADDNRSYSAMERRKDRRIADLEQKLTEQAALILALEAIDPEVIDVRGTMQFTVAQTDAIGRILYGYPPLTAKEEPKMTFDEYCDENNIQPGEEPAAFGAYLHALSGGSWDGAQHEVAPPDENQRGLTTCWQNLGWHVYSAGPCFETKGQAIAYRNSLDAEGVT